MKNNSLLSSHTIYLEALNQIFDQFKPVKPLWTKSSLFNFLLDQKILDDRGFPTERALSRGYIKIYNEYENLEFEEFIEVFDVFQMFNRKYFELIDGFWEIDEFLFNKIQAMIATNQFSNDHLYQLDCYFENRTIK